MNVYFYVFIGGFLGSFFKIFMSSSIVSVIDQTIPYHTLLVNITGCFILTFFVTLCGKKTIFDEDLRLGITTGFLGAYTTFSAISAETAFLLTNSLYQEAFMYLFLTIFLGVLAVISGTKIAEKFW